MLASARSSADKLQSIAQVPRRRKNPAIWIWPSDAPTRPHTKEPSLRSRRHHPIIITMVRIGSVHGGHILG